jgi:hypothetical protein
VAKLRAGNTEFGSWQEQKIIFFSEMFILALESTQISIQWVMRVLSLGKIVKASNSPLTST